MSVITGLEAWWATTEADVIAVITNIKADIIAVEADIEKAFDWINSNVGSINSAITEINGVLTTVSASGVLKIPAAATEAIELANKAVAGLNAYQQTVQANAAGGAQGQAAALIAGYTAIKQAQQAATVATLAVIQAPAATPTQAAQAAS